MQDPRKKKRTEASLRIAKELPMETGVERNHIPLGVIAPSAPTQ
jgi:hypothetical protein